MNIEQLPRATAWLSRQARPLTLGTALAAALLVAAAVGRWPLYLAGAIAAALLIGLLLCRLELAVAVLAAGFFFNAYLAKGLGILTVDKAIGALAVGAWALDWAVNRRPVLTSRGLWLLSGFLLWTAVSFAGVVNVSAAVVTSLRYVTFAVLYFLILQTVRGERRRADVIVGVVVFAATVASVIGLLAFFAQHLPRASGPLADPNDFGFLLASSLPLALYQLRWASARRTKALCVLALALILGCTLATFSRSALVGLAAAAAWAFATRRLKLRWLVAVLACLLILVGAALLAAPQIIQRDFGQKTHIATANVDVRLGYYRVELSEWRHYPIAGVGPGNFVYRFYQFAPAAQESLPFPSNVLTISGEEAYLVILAEQGAVGLALFLGYLAVSWADLRRRFPADRRRDDLQAAMAAGFIVACVGALFLAEQYYPPLWFLPAMGASMARGVRAAAGRRQRSAAALPAGRLPAASRGST
jgi:O-antigen ligase